MAQPATMTFRTVLIERDEGFVVWDELFELSAFSGTPTGISRFINGDYFNNKSDLKEALECFIKRLTRGLNNIESIYREESPSAADLQVSWKPW